MHRKVCKSRGGEELREKKNIKFEWNGTFVVTLSVAGRRYAKSDAWLWRVRWKVDSELNVILWFPTLEYNTSLISKLLQFRWKLYSSSKTRSFSHQMFVNEAHFSQLFTGHFVVLGVINNFITKFYSQYSLQNKNRYIQPLTTILFRMLGGKRWDEKGAPMIILRLRLMFLILSWL